MNNLFSFVIPFFLTQTACATSATPGMPCADPSTQAKRSQELHQISEADQNDRAWQSRGEQPSLSVLEKMGENDVKRRMRVGEIFGEGCLKSADDYASAYIVFQHGNTSGQYFQAFIWSKEALLMGSSRVAKGDVAMAVDRYLVSTGHKELFGTQASQPKLGGCWCIQPIEDSFPEAIRSEYRGGKNAEYTGLNYLKTLNKNTNCLSAYCDSKLLPTPQGTVPGFW